MSDVSDTPAVDVETELLRRAQAGDEAAFGELVRSNYERVFRHVVTMTRNEHDARDVSQEIWINVWRSLKDYRGDAKFSTWVHSIATRRAIDHLRKRGRWYSRFLPFLADGDDPALSLEPASPAPDPRDQLEHVERDARFQRAIASLPPKLQAVLAMREIEGLSYEEIARTLDCRPGTVMSRLFNARRLLAQKLGDLPCE
ncbi:MAG TPA: sigma-70 family RNA polymerase sigma factor [Opitutaceae bacterium]|nr:sigma-70 family RNA polymerase sigma factor [Opitutaceae bacterium]